MKVIIRTDASIEIGSGHVMRCLTIAGALRERGCHVLFMMNELPGNLIGLVQSKGFEVVHDFQPADLCIIDHYGIDERWEQSIRPFVNKIAVIDDLADRQHDCNLLLDQNTVPDFEARYDILVPSHCMKLLGPRYLIMRDEFVRERQQMRERDGTVGRLLIFMGGTDPTNETLKVLRALQKTNVTFPHIDVVVGAGNPSRIEIEKICLHEGFHFHCQIDYMASLMAQADFAIGAGGSATWERCYVGLPSLSTIVAENQIVATETAASLGAVLNTGWHEKVTVETYLQLLEALSNRQKELQEMSLNGLKLTGSPEGPNLWIKKIMELMQE
ncbi:UDP-2,4-diacetamido-2,4,6-trideoxy-beta-L-altropyranose hydrolase [Sporosarcina sp. FSL K6-3457]|uniref:UDP-2,4-diacetamido-2,4, 6-trideoxy-beta-L-altropyranose hydrolase n=1 Tax=Sporosarcina sp. FSL K6-3457 TaxID=2978204 RepID=UPI0030FC5F83